MERSKCVARVARDGNGHVSHSPENKKNFGEGPGAATRHIDQQSYKQKYIEYKARYLQLKYADEYLGGSASDVIDVTAASNVNTAVMFMNFMIRFNKKKKESIMFDRCEANCLLSKKEKYLCYIDNPSKIEILTILTTIDKYPKDQYLWIHIASISHEVLRSSEFFNFMKHCIDHYPSTTIKLNCVLITFDTNFIQSTQSTSTAPDEYEKYIINTQNGAPSIDFKTLNNHTSPNYKKYFKPITGTRKILNTNALIRFMRPNSNQIIKITSVKPKEAPFNNRYLNIIYTNTADNQGEQI